MLLSPLLIKELGSQSNFVFTDEDSAGETSGGDGEDDSDAADTEEQDNDDGDNTDEPLERYSYSERSKILFTWKSHGKSSGFLFRFREDEPIFPSPQAT